MTHLTHHPLGSPSWVELSTVDPLGAARFYGQLFDWSIDTDALARQGRVTCRSDDHPVAGLASAWLPDRSPRWLMHVTVADAGASATRIVASGGAVLVPPAELDARGPTALAADPAGAVFAIWQTEFMGAGVVDQPNAMCWFELATHARDAAVDFYEAVFDWHPHHHGDEPDDYVELHLDDESIAGVLPVIDGSNTWPGSWPNLWLVYFEVDDVDDATARVVELGGEVLSPPTDILPGRYAVVTDPHGAPFSVLTFRRDAA